MPDRPLTNKQLAFCREYIIDNDGTKAAIRAGYSAKTADQQASRLLTKVKIKQEISRLQAEIREEVGYTVAQCQQELEQARLLAITNNQPSAAVSAITTKARLFGMLTDNLHTTNQEHAADLTPEQEEQARAAIQAIRQGPRLSKEAI